MLLGARAMSTGFTEEPFMLADIGEGIAEVTQLSRPSKIVIPHARAVVLQNYGSMSHDKPGTVIVTEQLVWGWDPPISLSHLPLPQCHGPCACLTLLLITSSFLASHPPSHLPSPTYRRWRFYSGTSKREMRSPCSTRQEHSKCSRRNSYMFCEGVRSAKRQGDCGYFQ